MSKDEVLEYGVSVIIPIRNSSGYISKTIESVISSSTSIPYEIILIDDFSNDIDLTKEIVTKYENVILLQKNEKSNASVSRNIGISKSKYRFVFLLDSDDLFEPKYIADRIKFMNRNQSGIYFGPFKDYHNEADYNIVTFSGEINDLRDFIFLEHGDFRSSTISIDKKNYLGTLFDPLQDKHQDWGFAIRCDDAGELICYDTDNPQVCICKDRHMQMSRTMNVSASKYFINTYLESEKYIISFIRKHLLLCVLIKDFNAYFFFKEQTAFINILNNNFFYRFLDVLITCDFIRLKTPNLIRLLTLFYIKFTILIKGK
ncbi:glycosyltransferase family 2 protein [Tatumella citrea]|nr:glycosyltransferase family 2 protein [Tatumella citrea]